MKKNPSLALFLLLELSVLLFIFATAQFLPEKVASHFDTAGVPNGFMPRTSYTLFMVVFAIGIPALISGGMSCISRFPDSLINLPNKSAWLSENNRASTFAFLKMHALGLGAWIALFIGFVHWLVIEANRSIPAHLSTQTIVVGLVVFVIVLLAWAVMLPLKFMRPPKTE